MADLQEMKVVRRCLQELLEAGNEVSAIMALRRLFVEQMDFDATPGTVPLIGPNMPPSAMRIAARDGVQVVMARLTTTGRVLVRDIRGVLKQVSARLNGDLFLVAGDYDGGMWQLIYPRTRSHKEILRRIVLHRGQPHRTVVEQLSTVYERAKADIAQRLGRDAKPLGDTRVRRYLSRQFRLLREEYRENEEELKRIGVLQQIFPGNVPPRAAAAIEEMQNAGIPGDALVRSLESLRDLYRLNPPEDGDGTQSVQMGVLRVVCSDGLV